MSERGLVLMGGAPGSGTSRLGQSVEQRLRLERLSAEHISTGNRVRHIGAGIVRSAYAAHVITHLNTQPPHAPLHDEIIYGIVDEALDQHDDRDVVLLDGYPRYVSQVRPTEALAADSERQITGMLVTTVDTEVSLTRMIKRGQKHPDRAVTIDEAISRLAEYGLTFPQVIGELSERGIPITTIDTAGNKETTDQLGLAAVLSFLAGVT